MNISGTYPHLAVFSDQGEIGIGAVGGQALVRDLPAPRPGQQQHKLWTVDTNFALVARPESVGGTHANRMLHRESQQLIIGPCVIDTNGVVRVIQARTAVGRDRAATFPGARHLL